MTKLLRILFVVLFASVWKVGGAQTVETIWEEDWTGATDGVSPSEYKEIYSCGEGTVIKNSGKPAAGGELPELFLAANDVFKVNLTDLKGCTAFTLSFKSNRSGGTVTKNGEEVSENKYSSGVYTVTFSVSEDTKTLTLSFNLPNQGRLDNFKLTGTKVIPTSVSFGDKFNTSKSWVFVDGVNDKFEAPQAICSVLDAKGNMQYTTSNPEIVTVGEDGSLTFTNAVYGKASISAQWIGTDGYANSEKVSYEVSNRKALVFDENEKDAENDIQAYGLANITLKRTLYADGWNTFCVPFKISDLSKFGDGTKLMEFDSEDGNVLNFKEATIVEAGKPYLIKPAQDGEEYTFTGIGVVGTDPVEVGGNIKFKGLYHETDITAYGNVAGLASNNRIVEVKSGGTTKAFRAYFVLPQSQNAANYVLNIDGTTTAIDNVYVGGEKASAPVYNLQGQRVNATTSLPSGIYVQNGRKFVVK